MTAPSMSATDDARSTQRRLANRQPGARVPAAFALAGILPGALLGAALFAIPAILPAWPRYATTLPWEGAAPVSRATSPWAEAARLPGADVRLEVRAPSRAAAEALAERFEVERAGDGAPERDRRARLRAELAPRAPDPLPALAPATECATLLEARARIGRTLAGEGPVLAADDAATLPAALRDADQVVEAAALAFDPAALRPALAAADRLERAWLERLAAEDATRAFEAWRARERSRAAEFEDAATVLAADVTPFQHTLSTWWLPIFALELERGVPDAARAVSASRAAHPAPARPWWPAWVVAALAGALAGGAGSWLAARARPLPRPRPALASAERHVLPATSQAALHVLSGSESRRVALAALDVAAHFVARGERVLVVDGARRLGMHEQLGLEGGAGTLDCLAGRATLGTCVREVWGEGLYLLPVGLPG
ncbi:MAG TPA: hypothetical protein VL332_07125, partial [Candidatus Saccharimonadaceae bacterium]|nr:hypothetical protein [Candidatus Saccharimonadaceae bacterium]